MSIYSDHSCGALSDEEFKSLCLWENAKDRYEAAHEFDDMEEEEEK